MDASSIETFVLTILNQGMFDARAGRNKVTNYKGDGSYGLNEKAMRAIYKKGQTIEDDKHGKLRKNYAKAVTQIIVRYNKDMNNQVVGTLDI